MLSPEVLQKIRHLEIQTKRMLSSSFVGDTTVSHKGFGIEFDQLRDYQQGDDVRFIDWRATARMNKTMVKEYLDDRNRLIHLLVDVSPSMMYGSGEHRKIDIAAQAASVLALVADYGKDQVSLTLFNDHIVKHVPLNRGRVHVHEIMNQLFSSCEQEPESKGDVTSYEAVGHHVAQMMKRSSIVCVLSDFIGEQSTEHLARIAQRHDLIALRILDPLERALPSVGYIPCKDPESGKEYVINSSRSKKINKLLRDRIEQQNYQFKRHRIESVDIQNHSELMGNLIRFFRRRMMY